jgi:hypothetical protein
MNEGVATEVATPVRNFTAMHLSLAAIASGFTLLAADFAATTWFGHPCSFPSLNYRESLAASIAGEPRQWKP